MDKTEIFDTLWICLVNQTYLSDSISSIVKLLDEILSLIEIQVSLRLAAVEVVTLSDSIQRIDLRPER